MPNNYKEYLKEQYEEAMKEFEYAKKESIKSIETMNWTKVKDYGAAYASYIDKISIAAAKVSQIVQLVTAYNFYNPENVLILEP